MATRITGEGGIDPHDLCLRQVYIGGAGIFFDMLDARRFGDRDDWMPMRQKCKRHLAGSHIMRHGDTRKQTAARRVIARKTAVPE